MIAPEPMGHAPPTGSPDPPLIVAGRGRLRFFLARLRLAWRSFRSGWSIFMESRVGMLALFTIIVFGLMAAVHPLLMTTVWDPATYDPVTGYSFGQSEQPAPPSWKHPLGTDPLGRDVLSQLLYSARSEFVLGITAALVTVGIATVVGAVAAYFGGLLDAFFMRLADLIIALPAISLLIVLERPVRPQPVLSGLDNRSAGRLWRNRHHPEVPGVEHPGQALHRGGAGRRRRDIFTSSSPTSSLTFCPYPCST